MRPRNDAELAAACLDALERRGFDKAQVRVVSSTRDEVNTEFNRLSLLRTNHDTKVTLLGIAGARSGMVTLNKRDADSIAGAVEELWEIAGGATPDPANDIAPAQPARRFQRGPEEADRDAMAGRLQELIDYAREQHPTLTIRQGFVDFVSARETFLNSNGVDFESRNSRYGASVMFSAREGTLQSSFNYTGMYASDLDVPLHRRATLAELMRQSTEQVRTRKVPAPFSGDLVIAPDCLDSFLGFLYGAISDVPLIGGTSLYRGRLGERVASEALTVHSRPLDLPGGYFVTSDGFETQNECTLERGVLRGYLLDLYGANKTGLPRAKTGGGCWVMEPGAKSRDELIAGVERGIFITRFSGGRPNDRGDFSGIAKNSYYVERGVLRHPVSETMVSGNLDALLNHVVDVSRERADFGDRIYPWVRVTGIGVS